MKPTTLQYRASTSKASYRQLEPTMLQMRHPRNALIRHRDAAHGAHRHAFSLSLQNPHLTDLHRREPTFKKYARRLLESVAREVKSCRTYFKLPDISRPNTASPYRNRTSLPAADRANPSSGARIAATEPTPTQTRQRISGAKDSKSWPGQENP